MSQIALGVLLVLLPIAARAQNVARTRNPHGPLPVRCELCHTASGWSPIRQHPEFDHNTQTAYPLRGGHIDVACTSCHVNLVFKNVAHTCAGCHADLHRGQFGANCDQCHSVKGWTPVSQQLTASQHTGRFPLIGAHAHVTCEGCHPGAGAAIYTGLSTECIACHRNDYLKTQNPPHQAANFPLDCSSCHSINATGWFSAKFDHNAFAHFALDGAHVTVPCNSCHINGRFAGTPTTCAGCHLKDFQGTTNPPHASAGFSTDCKLCHTTATWLNAKVDHSGFGFPLTGAHAAVTCAACHKNNQFAGLPTNCVGCHLADFQSTNNPSHASAGFSTDCAQCHTTSTWANATFDHSKTAFPLTGAHTTVQCNQCHTGGQYASAPKNCDACHLADFRQTNNPSHVQSGFPLDCSICHSTAAWTGANFNHTAVSNFALTGAHATQACTQCHSGGNFATAPRNCDGCHLPEFKQTTNPNHAQAGFPLDCSICHSTVNWDNAVFDHSKTPFPLTGAHTTLQCSQCHTGGSFASTPKNCDACHLPLYNATTNPNHIQSAFPLDCSICHSTINWTSATFDHSKTVFPLTGAHVTLQCNQCHVNGKFAGTPTTCDACHLPLFNATTNPNHIAAGFATDCSVCHTTANWTGAVFDHSKTKFQLTGAHTTLQCNQCHNNTSFSSTPTSGNYLTVPTDCYSCHKTDYSGTTNPNHIAAAFPTTCALCHTTTTWLGATFNHTWFPIYSGTHRQGVWTTCGDCHIDPSNFAAFSCINCHQHSNKASVDSEHRGVRGYTYAPTSCYSCHANGGGG